MIRKVLVLGGGSAGFLAAINLKAKIPDLEVTLLRSKGIGIIGVGEGTVATVPKMLHGYLGIDPEEFYREARPTWKLGIRFVWGPRSSFNYTFKPQMDTKYQALTKATGYYCDEGFDYAETASALMTHDRVFLRRENGTPHIGPDTAYHLENKTFVAYLERLAVHVGVNIVEDTVTNVEQDETGIAALNLESGNTLTTDLYVDCSGFASVLLGKTMGEPFIGFKSSLLCDRAVVGGWERGPNEPIKPYTTSETMNAGWAWQIEHEHHVTRGYVYSSDFISDEDADREFREKNPRIEDTRVVRFVSGRYRNAWVKNVVAIGNAGGFVEPLEATSIGVICNDCQAMVESIRDCDRELRPSLARAFNRRSAVSWDTIRQFLAIHYKFNTRLDTPFWRACRADVDICGAEPIVEYYQENGPSTLWREILVHRKDMFELDGYLTLLVGMKVPYRQTFTPTDEELETWKRIQSLNRKDGLAGMTSEEALAMVRSPAWKWDRRFFQS